MKTCLLPLCFATLLPGLCQAETLFSPYVGAGYEVQTIGIDETDFDTSLLTVNAGAWLWQGIGFELELGRGLSDDTVEGVSTKPTQHMRYGIRLQTPPTEGNTLLYVLFGGVTAGIDTQTGGNNLPGENNFSGYHTGVGIGTRIDSKLQLDISYNNYQVDESFDISGVRIGIQYAFAGAFR